MNFSDLLRNVQAQLAKTPFQELAQNLRYAEGTYELRDYLRDRIFQDDRLVDEFLDAVANGQPFSQRVKWKLKLEQEPPTWQRRGGQVSTPAPAARPQKTCPHCGKPLPESKAGRLVHGLLEGCPG